MTPTPGELGTTTMAIQGKPQLFLAVFGKHPGWDDHIDDLGIETKRLAEVKRVMYEECIAGNIDSGSWEALDDSARLAAFAHEFVWRSPGGLVVGRLWSSKDGKGRSKYPMVVVAQCDGVPTSFLASQVMPALAGLQERFQGAATAGEVTQAAADARSRLREALAGAGPGAGAGSGEAFVAPPKELASTLAGAGLSGDSVALQRVMYEIDREMAPFRPIGKGDGKKSTRLIDARAQHLRVPMIGVTSLDAARFWMGVLAREVDGGVSQITLVPLAPAGEIGFADLVVGDPGPAQLFCLRAGGKALAPASDVPYTMTPDFMARCKATVAAWSGEVVKAPEPAASKPPAPQAATQMPEAQAAPSQEPVVRAAAPVKKKFPWFLPVAAVVVVGGALAAWRPWEDKKPNIAINDKPVNEKPTTLPEVKPPELKPDPAAEARKSEEARKLEEARKADEARKTEEARKAKEEADRKANEEADRRLKEDADRKAKEDADRVASVDAERKAKEEATRKVKEEADRKAKEEADRKAKEAAARTAAEVEKQRDDLRRQFIQLDALLQRAFVIGEKSADGSSVDSIFAKVSANPEFAAFRDATPAARETFERVGALHAIPASTDAGELAAHATGARLAEQMAAWSRLGSGAANWPASATDLKGAAATVATMETSTNDVGGERGTLLKKRMLADAAKIWTRYAAAQTSAESLLEAESYRDDFRVKPGDVPAPIRYNLEVAKLRRDAAAFKNDAGDDAIRARLASFVAGAGDAKGAGLEGVLALLNATASAGVDPTKSGPGAKGWRAEVRDNGQVVAFTLTGVNRPARTLEFARIEIGGVTSYLATTEASIGLLVDAADNAQAWSDVLGVLPPASRGEQVTWVRGWEWKMTGKQATAIQPATNSRDWTGGWFAVANFGSMTSAKKEMYPSGARPASPTAETPMQYLSVGAAAYVAGLAGCRLPTAAEWAAASADAGGTPNLRDAAWKKVFDQCRPIVQAPKPYEGVFGGEVKAADVAPAVTTDDGVVWFTEVGAGPGSRFKNLIGNVAEFVTTVPVDPVTSRAEAAKLAEFGRVVGASALSPSKVDPATPMTIARGSAGFEFSDVGFRLAFTAGAAAKPVPITNAAFQSAVQGLQFAASK